MPSDHRQCYKPEYENLKKIINIHHQANSKEQKKICTNYKLNNNVEKETTQEVEDTTKAAIND